MFKEKKSFLKIGTRKSGLALAQSEEVREIIKKKLKLESKLVTFETKGDLNLSDSLKSIVQKSRSKSRSKSGSKFESSQVDQKGLFTEEIENSLISGGIDLAVHSLKDLPTKTNKKELFILAITQREIANDVLICAKKHREKKLDSLEKLPKGAKIGTSSPRREKQLKLIRPDFKIKLLRGNIETRIRKIEESEEELDGGILAYAGLKRRKIERVVSEVIKLEHSVPAPGQGALAIQTSRKFYTENQALADKLSKALNDQKTSLLVKLERELLNLIEAGCSSPFGAYASFKENTESTIELKVFWGKENFYLKKDYLLEVKNLEEELNKIKEELLKQKKKF